MARFSKAIKRESKRLDYPFNTLEFCNCNIVDKAVVGRAKKLTLVGFESGTYCVLL